MKYGNYTINEDNDTSVSKIINLIEEKSNVIEFGSSYGYILDYLKNKKQCNVRGYEVDIKAVNLAIEHGIPTEHADLDSVKSDFFETLDMNIDYIICADVFEHLKNMMDVIHWISLYLEKNKKCKLLVSFPNITYYGVINQLLHGNFKYTDLGILDNTHLHFYDKFELEKIFNNNSLEVCTIDYINVDPKNSEFKVQLDKEVIDLLERYGNKDYLTYQYVFNLKYSATPNEEVSLGTLAKSAIEDFNDKKDSQIIELNSIVNKKDSQIIELNSIVNKKDSQIIELNSIVNKKDSQIIELNSIVNKKDSKIIELREIAKMLKNYLINKYHTFLIKYSSLFDPTYYQKTYLEDNKINMRIEEHYLNIGWELGYNPSEKFNTNDYLTKYPDVKDSKMNPLLHYIRYGKSEKRTIGLNKVSLIRRLYQYSPFLKKLWGKYKNLKLRFSDNSPFIFSKNNLKAIEALSSRRDAYIDKMLNYQKIDEVILPEIDISVVVYNSEKWINDFFISLKEQSYPLDKINLFFIDHSPIDETYNVLFNFENEYNSYFKDISIVRQENKGFGYGHDKAVSISKSKFILVANIDLVFTRDSIINVVKDALYDEDKEYASWEFRQIPYEHPKYYDPVTLETNWSSHACILIRREAYDSVGGYEPKIFMYAEDVELSYRFRANGWNLKYCPDSVVEHYTYDEINQVKPLQFEGSTLGNAYIRYRYGSTNDKNAALPLLFALLLQKERFKGSRKIVLKNIFKIFKERKYFSKYKNKNNKFFASLRGFDYEMIRDGAFYEIDLPKDTPLVSVIVRTYQGRNKFLAQCLVSIINQTYKNIEIIVVEDGSNTMKELVEKFSNLCTLKYYSFDKIGRSATGNNGLKNSSGEYCVFLDDDDLFFADHIEILLSSLLKNKEATAAYSLAFEVPTKIINDNKDYKEATYSTQNLFYQEFDYDVLTDHNYFPIQAVLFKKELFLQRGGFDESLTYLEDWNLWLRYAYENTFIYNEKTTSLYRTPADENATLERNKLLHQAYYIAKNHADNHIKKINKNKGKT